MELCGATFITFSQDSSPGNGALLLNHGQPGLNRLRLSAFTFLTSQAKPGSAFILFIKS